MSKYSPIIRKIIIDLAWKYIKDPSQAPKGRKVEQTPRGKWRYETKPRGKKDTITGKSPSGTKSNKVIAPKQVTKIEYKFEEGYDPLVAAAAPDKYEGNGYVSLGPIKNVYFRFLPDQDKLIKSEYGNISVNPDFYKMSADKREETILDGLGHLYEQKFNLESKMPLYGLNNPGPFGRFGKYIFGKNTLEDAMAAAFVQYQINPSELQSKYNGAYEFIHNDLNPVIPKDVITLPSINTSVEVKKSRKYIKEKYELPYGAELHTLKSGRMFYYPIETEPIKWKEFTSPTDIALYDQEDRRRIDKSMKAYADGVIQHEPWNDKTNFDKLIDSEHNKNTSSRLSLYIKKIVGKSLSEPFVPISIDDKEFDNLFSSKFEGGIRDEEGKLVGVPYRGRLFVREFNSGDNQGESEYKKEFAIIKAMLFDKSFKDEGLKEVLTQTVMQDLSNNGQISFDMRKYLDEHKPHADAVEKYKSFFKVYGSDPEEIVRNMVASNDHAGFLADLLARYYGKSTLGNNKTVEESKDELKYLLKTEPDAGQSGMKNILSLLNLEVNANTMKSHPVMDFKDKIVHPFSLPGGTDVKQVIGEDGVVTYRANLSGLGTVDIRHISDTRQRLNQSERLKKKMKMLGVDQKDIDILYNKKSTPDELKKAALNASVPFLEIYKKVQPNAKQADIDRIITSLNGSKYFGGYSDLTYLLYDVPDDVVSPVVGGITTPLSSNGDGIIRPIIYVDDTFVNSSPEEKQKYLNNISNKQFADTFLSSRGIPFDEHLRTIFGDESTLNEAIYQSISKTPDNIPASQRAELQRVLYSPDGHIKCYHSKDTSASDLYPDVKEAYEEPQARKDWQEFKSSKEYVTALNYVDRLKNIWADFKVIPNDLDSEITSMKLFNEYSAAQDEFDKNFGNKERDLWRYYYDNYLNDKAEAREKQKKSEVSAKVKSLFTASSDKIISPEFITDPNDTRFGKSGSGDWEMIPIDEEGIKIYHEKVEPKVMKFLQTHVDERLWKDLSPVITYTTSDRGFHSTFGGKESISLNKNRMDSITTFVHEFGHVIESVNPKIHDALIKFLKLRIQGEKEEKLSEWTGNEDYKDYEIATKDHFPDAYCGKNYGGRSSELLSMGLQWMYSRPESFLRDDPEYFQLILDIMHGVYND